MRKAQIRKSKHTNVSKFDKHEPNALYILIIFIKSIKQISSTEFPENNQTS